MRLNEANNANESYERLSRMTEFMQSIAKKLPRASKVYNDKDLIKLRDNAYDNNGSLPSCWLTFWKWKKKYWFKILCYESHMIMQIRDNTTYTTNVRDYTDENYMEVAKKLLSEYGINIDLDPEVIIEMKHIKTFESFINKK